MKGDKTRRGVRFTVSQIEWLGKVMDRTGLDGSTIVRARFGEPKEYLEGSDPGENLTRNAVIPSGAAGTTRLEGPRAWISDIGLLTETSGTMVALEPTTTHAYVPIVTSLTTTGNEVTMKPIKIPIVTMATEPVNPMHVVVKGAIPGGAYSRVRYRPVLVSNGKFVRLLARARQVLAAERETLLTVTQERDRARRELAHLHRMHDDLLREMDDRASAPATARRRQPRVEADGLGRAYVVVPAKDWSGKRVLVKQRLHGFRLERQLT